MSYALVEMSGGVVQTEEASPGVLLVTIDWDEINDTDENTALEYAVRILEWITELPDEVRERLEQNLHEALEVRGYPVPVERNMQEPALCSERLDGDCHVIFDEARGDAYCGACPACADRQGDPDDTPSITVTTADSWDLLLRGLEDVSIRVNGKHELRVTHHAGDTLYGRPWDEAEQIWDGRPEVVIPISTITSIHII